MNATATAAPPDVGRRSAKSRAADAALLSGLGHHGAAAGPEPLADNPRRGGPLNRHLIANSRLSSQEKVAIKKIAANVSEELGSRLLVPTPGSRAILGTIVKVTTNHL